MVVVVGGKRFFVKMKMIGTKKAIGHNTTEFSGLIAPPTPSIIHHHPNPSPQLLPQRSAPKHPEVIE
jgi:hypothetical protein